MEKYNEKFNKLFNRGNNLNTERTISVVPDSVEEESETNF